MPIPHLKIKSPEDSDRESSHRVWPRRNQSLLERLIRVLAGLFIALMPARWRSSFNRWRNRGLRRRRNIWWRFVLPIGTALFLLFVLAGISVFAWFSRDLPDPNKISDRSVAQSTKIYARDGQTLLYEVHGDEKRTVVELSEISPKIIDATIAIEDKDFRKHKGFSLAGIVRALWKDLTTGSSQGGSTITQQFVKNAILTSEKKVTRKIRELVLAYQIERRFDKDQILKLYFNEIPYGSNTYGAEAAAQTYFGKRAKDVTLAEAAILAALPQAPTYYSPYGSHTDELLGRAHYTLDQMVQQGRITAAEAAAAKAEKVLDNVKPKRETITAPHFVFYVREVLTRKYGERAVERDGLRVTTTLDPKMQEIAEKVIAEYAADNEKRWGANNAALVAVDPKSGQVLAMVGSRDYFDESIDGNVNVALTLQQPGSSIKPIVYATAFSRGFTPDTKLFDIKTRFKIDGAPDYVPNNYDGSHHGPMSMRSALAGSLNIPAVKTLYLAGLNRVIDQAQKMGYTTWSDRSRLGLSLVLGGGDVKLIEHTAAFGSLAADGILFPTTPIMKIQDRNGKVIEEFRGKGSRVLDQEVARTVSDVLSDNKARSFIFGSRSKLVLPDRPVAAKTGTTQEYRDAWAVGYTPSLVAGVWVGDTRNAPMRRGADGSIVAAPIWNAFMRQALAGTEAEEFPKPNLPRPKKAILRGQLSGEAPIKVDRVTGREIPAGCLDDWPASYVIEKSLKSIHTILYYVDPEDPAGPASKDPTKDPQFTSWESAVQTWIKDKDEYLEERPEKESCDLRRGRPEITILEPEPNSTARGDTLNVRINVDHHRPLAIVRFSLDGTVIASSANSTSALIDLRQVENGFHTIDIFVRDDAENSAQTSLEVNVQHDATQSRIYFVQPNGNTAVSAGQSLELRAYASDPAGITNVIFSLITPEGDSADVGSAAPGSDSLAAVSWIAPAAPGRYRVFFRAQTTDGRSLQSDYISIRVNQPA